MIIDGQNNGEEKSESMSDNGDDDNEANREPNTLSDFFKENSELFTIIGVFTAVAFYFIQFEEVPSEQIEIGLVSSLVIFTIVSLVGIKMHLMRRLMH